MYSTAPTHKAPSLGFYPCLWPPHTHLPGAARHAHPMQRSLQSPHSILFCRSQLQLTGSRDYCWRYPVVETWWFSSRTRALLAPSLLRDLPCQGSRREASREPSDSIQSTVAGTELAAFAEQGMVELGWEGEKERETERRPNPLCSRRE